MDISDTLAPNSDQLDAVDLLSGPQTFTIERVSRADGDQPVNIHLAGFPRPWRPGKSMRRVLVSCWGPDAAKYVGRRVTLFCDPEVRFGGQAVGGTRVSHLSHMPNDKPKSIPLLVTRGKSAPYVVKPLPADAAPVSPAVSPDTLTELTGLFQQKGVPEDKWLEGVNYYTKGSATALEVITEDQARHMITELGKRPDADTPATEELPDPTLDADWQAAS